MHRITYIILLALAVLYLVDIPIRSVYGEVLGTFDVRSADEIGMVSHRVEMATTTVFDQREETVAVPIEYNTEYEKDPDLEYGLERVEREGEPGKRTSYYLITFWQDEEIDRTLLATETEPPVSKIIAQGTKIIWRTLSGTEYGDLDYWKKLRVWATKYDANCIGCTGRTFSGTEVKKGVCAVDPRVIPLGTNFYVVGYGMCRAEDIGGAIKGNIIDLGYEVAALGAWRTGWTDIYILSNPPVTP
jgi:3D (Asp-Asp-Asp) domain-containing protein